MVLDGPMWRLYCQKYTVKGKPGTIIMFKSHHSFCDGMSTMSMSLAMSAEYDRSYFVKGADASMMARIVTRLSFPFMIPFLLWDTAQIKKDENYITKNKQKGFSGVMNCDCTEDFKFKEVKELSKKIGSGITINDLISSAITCSLKKLFMEKGDNSDSVNIVIPASVRFEFYPKREDVKLENKFSAIPVVFPLTETMEGAYPKIKKASSKLKNKFFNFLMTYGTYAFTFYSNAVFPKSISRRAIDMVTPNFTMGFSNLPGPIKPLYYNNHDKTQKFYAVASHTYIVVSGFVGLGCICMSFCDSFKLTLTSDDGILSKEDNRKLIKYIEDFIRGEKLRMKDV